MGDDVELRRPQITTCETLKIELKRTIPAFEFNLACKRVLEATKENGFSKGIC